MTHTVCIILPFFITFAGEVSIDSTLRALANPNDPFSEDDLSNLAMSYHYAHLLRPLSALRTVVLALDGQHICSVWPWRVLEDMIRVFVLGGIVVHLESDLRCVQAAISMPVSPLPLVTSWTVFNLAYGDRSVAVFAKVLKRLQLGLRHLTIKWNPRERQFVVYDYSTPKLTATATAQDPLIEAFQRALKEERISLHSLTTLQWTMHDIFIGEPAPDPSNIFTHYLPTPTFALGGLTDILDTLPPCHSLKSIILDLQGVMTEHTSFWNECTSDIPRVFSALQLYLCRPTYTSIQLNANITFMSWKISDVGDINSQAEQWGCARGVSAVEAEQVKQIFWSQRSKFNVGWWNVRCLCTAETALWDDSTTDVLDATGMWFDDARMPPPSRAAW
jgi:hypothetical protein